MEITELDFSPNNRSSNFGSGIELLMNDKVKEQNRPTSDINLEDLDNLENELNELSGTKISAKSDLFEASAPSIRLSGFEDAGKEDDTKTWDGFGKFNNIPINPDIQLPSEPKMTKEETMKEKFKYLRKLEQLEKKGVELSKKYNMDSSLQEMMGEYETIMDEKSKQNSVKFQGNMMMAIINGIEFLNNKFDPFDIKLDGWGEQFQENISDYDDVFAELHEKYKNKGSLAPELNLLFRLGGSAMMVHLTNTMFKSALPGVDDIFRQNPDLMRSFQNATVNSMAQTNPGFSGFMSGLMNPTGPPPPMATQGPNAVPPPAHRPGNNFARPDLNMSMGMGMGSGNIGMGSGNMNKSPAQRPEMKGPSDITSILSGLKTKTINIQQPQQNQSHVESNNDSTISMNDLKEMQNEGMMPKRSARRKKSASNIVSLDI